MTEQAMQTRQFHENISEQRTEACSENLIPSEHMLRPERPLRSEALAI